MTPTWVATLTIAEAIVLAPGRPVKKITFKIGIDKGTVRWYNSIRKSKEGNRMMDKKTAMRYLEIMMEEHQDVLLRLKDADSNYYNNLKNFFPISIDKQD